MDMVRGSETLKAWRTEHNHSKPLGILRILLGLFLMFMGIYFAQNRGELISIFSQSRFEFGAIALAHYIIMIHFAGGIMIAAGFLTRVAAWFQLPILIGAVIVNSQGVFGAYQNFVFSLIALLMVVFYTYFGSGMYSLGTYLKRKEFYE